MARDRSAKHVSASRAVLRRFAARAVELGAAQAKMVRPSDVVCAHWVRLKCRYGCDGFGTCHMCPPHSPTPTETRQVLDEYRALLLVHGKRWREVTRLVVRLEREVFLAGFPKAFAWGAGPCVLCRRCELSRPCQHPERARPSMEASGIDVFATARRAGCPIEVVATRAHEPNYYGLLAIE
jgi:predicted metal-binding protein